MPSDVFKIRSNARSASKDGRLFILDVNTGKYYSVNQVGAAIWAGLELGRTKQELISALLEKFDVAEGKLIADIDALVARLSGLGLIEVVPTPKSPRSAALDTHSHSHRRQV
jgi:hypothetical protein